MSLEKNVSIIREHTQLNGNITKCHRLENFGYIEGDVKVDTLVVHQGGRLFGKVQANNAEINGEIQGDIKVINLIKIGASGSVSGNVQYGQMALENGGILSADVRNVPPELGGDLHIRVAKGKSVSVTLTDLSAFDPDDAADALTFKISNLKNGFIALSQKPTNPVVSFTQADLEAGKIIFVHNGASASKAGFDVVVSDADGASSGAPQTVNVDVNMAV